MSKRIVIDPITRIEGHLRMEAILDENDVITNAAAVGTLWRGLETIAKGRDPRDVGHLIQRICGVCTYSHYKAGIMAAEDALGIKPPLNSTLTRTLMGVALFMHDHPVHFYHLHGLDWVDIVSALSADPKKASELAFKYADIPMNTGTDELLHVQTRVKKFAESGNLGPFANAYWGHPTYRFTPEQNLIALSHYLKGLEVQRTAAQMMAIFGSKQPHPQSLTVGGVTCVMDLVDPSRLGEFLTKMQEVSEFINRAYMADILMAAEAYGHGGEKSVLSDINLKNFMTYKEFPYSEKEYLFDSGIIMNGDLSKVYELDEELITEEATHAWFKNDAALHPYDGETDPNYTGLRTEKTIDGHGHLSDSKVVDMEGKYSWMKTPRYDGHAMEVGPLANILVNYAKGNPAVTGVVNTVLKKANLPAEALFSTLGRTAARAIETKVVADNGAMIFNKLVENLKTDTETCAPYVIDSNKEYKGRYIGNVPRGMLSHWIRIKDGVVENYQAVVPTTWNAGPIDKNGVHGAYEANLIGVKLADPAKPLEIIRIIHSFDPCIACSVHVMDTKGNSIAEYKVDPVNGATSC